MKIQGLNDALQFFGQVQDKDREKGNPDKRRQQRQGYGSDKKKSNFEESLEVSQAELEKAVEAFKTDEQAKANGLNAKTDGQGPGLKVILTDNSGKVVRQFTGEEFLKLRSDTHQEGRVRGKILDQKL